MEKLKSMHIKLQNQTCGSCSVLLQKCNTTFLQQLLPLLLHRGTSWWVQEEWAVVRAWDKEYTAMV